MGFGLFVAQFALIGIGIGIGNFVIFATDVPDSPSSPMPSSAVDIDPGNCTMPDEFHPEYLDKTKPPPKGTNVYYTENMGHCGWWNGSGYEKPVLDYVNAFKPQEEYEEDITQGDEGTNRFCLYQFHRAATQPVCGQPYYANIKYCAMVQFYQNQKPHPIENEEEKDLMLVLVDGCLICRGGQVGNVQVALVNEWEEGTTFTKCEKEERKPDWFDVKMQKDTESEQNGSLVKQFTSKAKVMPASIQEKITKSNRKEKLNFDHSSTSTFAFPLVLYQRRCQGIFSEDDKLSIYKGMKLMVKHNCGGGGTKTMNVNLADIDPKKFQNNMVELRGMMLILDDNKWLQYRMESYKYLDDKELEEDGGKPIYENEMGDDADGEEGKKKRRRRKK